jgi:hypothetical protein
MQLWFIDHTFAKTIPSLQDFEVGEQRSFCDLQHCWSNLKHMCLDRPSMESYMKYPGFLQRKIRKRKNL